MRKCLSVFAVVLFVSVPMAAGQRAASFILLGDVHLDWAQDHDPAFMAARPEDRRQSTAEYQVHTGTNWTPFTDLLRKQAAALQPPVKAVVQLGDLQEGLAGTPELARQMAQHAVEAVRAAQLPVPWLLVKGNHDITGPGAPEAYAAVVVPFLREELKLEQAHAYYACRFGDAEFICLDYYPSSGPGFLPFLEKQLAASTARYKFVALHEPVIPVTGRCWHVLRRPQDRETREHLLSLLARYKAIVLCGHLHKYAVVRRVTPDGPVVQAMVSSVIADARRHEPSWSRTKYGPELVDIEPKFSPETREQRRQMLTEEARYVTDFRLADLPGYGVLAEDPSADRVLLQVFGGLSETSYQEVDLTALLRAGDTSTRPPEHEAATTR